VADRQTARDQLYGLRGEISARLDLS